MTAACALLQIAKRKCDCCNPPRAIQYCLKRMGKSLCLHDRRTSEYCWQCEGDEDPALRVRTAPNSYKPKRVCKFCTKEYAYTSFARHLKGCKMNPAKKPPQGV